MFSSKGVAVLLFVLCMFPEDVRGWDVCYWTCLPIVGAGEVGALFALGFTNAGIRAGSWAAKWMAGFKGFVPKGGWFSFFQSRGARATSRFGFADGLCGFICKGDDFFSAHKDEDFSAHKDEDFFQPRDAKGCTCDSRICFCS